MKNTVLILALLFGFVFNARADDGKDVNHYDVIHEADFAVLLHDIKKSMIKKSTDEIDGELRAAFVIGNLELLSLKKSLIENMTRENFSVIKRKINLEKLDSIDEPVIKAINEFLPTVKSLELADGFIYMYMQMPEFYGSTHVEEYSKAFLHNAESIAISRFDNKYWFNKIKTCFNNNKSDDDLVHKITKCAEEYEQLVSQETDKVLKQLEPYKELYEGLPQQTENISE